jgi:2-polyprenyl-3-methyl-5-hydroxy-6-metoxy-1,4-benzoquinol methylase
MDFDKKKFWDKKILGWEDKRYSFKTIKLGSLSANPNSLGSSIQFRLQKSTEILKPYLPGKKLLELGCGSGLLLNALNNSKLEKYTGVDWALSAIEKADAKFQGINQSLPAEFIAGNLLDVEFPEFDVVVALGVLDWLEIDEIKVLFSKIKSKMFLFSISEKKDFMKRWCHSIYVFFAYGWKNEGYTPKYYTVDEIVRIACNYGYNNVKILRDPRMSFGTILYQLD